MRTIRVLQALAGAAAVFAFLGLARERDAAACGGCFTPPPPPNEVESVITDERMLLSISTQQTTLYDQINYSGSPSSFAWVLPIKGTVTVGLSADILFDTIDQLTATQVVQPPTNCPPPPTCQSSYPASGFAEAAGDSADAGAATVTVTAHSQVGPYETVQLHSTDGSALNQWLTAHGYSIPSAVAPVIAGYVADHFDFLALKLVPGVGVQAMQPVRVTSQGAAPSLPLRMVAVGTGPTTGISIWVVADGRWEPQNFPVFTIDEADVAWDWATSSSNYETLRVAKEKTYGGKGWQLESSLELSQYTISNAILQTVEYGSGDAGSYTPIGAYGGGADGGGPADAGVTGDASALHDAGGDADEELADSGYGSGTLDAANADLAVLFTGISGPNVRVTRLRSDVAHSALSVDMALAGSTDQSEKTNILNPQKQIGEPQCTVYNSSCVPTGTAPRSQVIASEATGGGGSCNTSRSSDEGPGAALAIVAGMLGLVVVRARRAKRP